MLAALLLAAQEHAPAGAEKSSNPILPSGNELVWGALSFLVLMVLIYKVGFPAIKKGMDARAEKIRSTLTEADRAKDEAESVLEEYRRQLADAKGEAGRIIEEARQAADKIRQDLRKQAESEVAELKQRAQDDITAMATRTMADLRAQVSLLAVELAGKVVEKNLDNDTNKALVERFIQQLGSDS